VVRLDDHAEAVEDEIAVGCAVEELLVAKPLGERLVGDLLNLGAAD
jgi:hypothetical protein